MSDQSTDRHNLSGQIAVVTGAAQGLGLAMSERLARDGATVVMADLQQEKVQTEASLLQKAGLSVHSAVLDVADSAGVNSFFDSVVEQHGSLDILVNNAGIGQARGAVIDTPVEELQRVMAVNFEGGFCAAFWKRARRRPDRASPKSGWIDSTWP